MFKRTRSTFPFICNLAASIPVSSTLLILCPQTYGHTDRQSNQSTPALLCMRTQCNHGILFGKIDTNRWVLRFSLYCNIERFKKWVTSSSPDRRRMATLLSGKLTYCYWLWFTPSIIAIFIRLVCELIHCMGMDTPNHTGLYRIFYNHHWPYCSDMTMQEV